ncbi:MAG: cytidylate kinase-like family protein [Clostridia bacterium]|nr:cytidylate kinase-like family protein [Clostridia bacterium]
MQKYIITIGRQFGSGGIMIAYMLSQKLGIPLYDKKMVTLAAQASGLPESVVEEYEQKRSSSFLYSLYMSTQQLPIQDQIFIAQSNVIKDLAKKESCIILGRCADYILRDEQNCFKVFIHAPLEERISRVRDEYKAEAKDYEKYVLKKDKERSEFYNYNCHTKWGDPKNYHLVINSTIGLNAAAETIKCAVEKMLSDKEGGNVKL